MKATSTPYQLLRLFLASLYLILSAGLVFADGPPVDRNTGEVTEPHTLIDLTPSQVDELETMETITFLSEQWAELRKVSPSCPKRLVTMIPWNYDDCSCSLIGETYGIVLSSTRIAVVHGEWSAKSLAYEIRRLGETDICELRIGREGMLYLKGSPVSPGLIRDAFGVIREKDGIREKDNGDSPFLAIRLPLGMARDDKSVKETIDQVYQIAEAAGWETMNKYERPKNKS